MRLATPDIDIRRPANWLPSREQARHAALLVAAGLVGFAAILWVAANWDGFAKMTRFWLVGGAVAAGGIAALLHGAALVPGLLVAFCATGALLALIGQTYQTGADAWQLFALWAALGLPLAMAARSDALWTPLVAVAMTAVMLWQTTTLSAAILFNGSSSLGSALWPTLASWGIGLAVCAAFAPGSHAPGRLGSTRWAFRLGLVAVLANVTTWGASALLSDRSTAIDIAIAAAVVIGGIATWLVRRQPRDALLVSVTALAADVLFVSVFLRAFIVDRMFSGAQWFRFFLVGAFAAAVVAASVVVVLRWLRNDDLQQVAGGAGNSVPTVIAANRPWPAVALSAFGAVLAFIPLVTALGLLLGPALMQKGPSIYVIGGLIAAGSGYGIRRADRIFAEQLAAIAFATGAGLLIYGLYRDLPDGIASLIVAAGLIAVALAIGRAWLAGILAVAATMLLAFGLLDVLRAAQAPGSSAFLAMWSVLAVAWIALSRWHDASRAWLETRPSAAMISPMTAGMAVAILLALSVLAGQTFLVDGLLGTGMTRVHAASDSAAFWKDPAKLFGVALMLAALAMLFRADPITPSPAIVAAALVAVGLAAAMPRLGTVAVVLAGAVLSGRRGIAMLAVIAIFWIVGNFYYALDLPLTRKALILGVCGAALGAGAWFSRSDAAPEDEASTRGPAAPGWARALAAAGLVATGAVATYAIAGHEALIRYGRPVYVELAPVDPRSLMQGDYMALRFRLPDAALRDQSRFGARPVVAGKVDGKGIVSLDRVADRRSPIAPDEMRIELTPASRGAWTIVTNAWFFKEGTAKAWEPARYGEFRVLPNGRALLVGMADKDLRRLLVQ